MSKDKQPKLKAVKKEYEDYTRKRNKAAEKAVEEMLKRPYSLQQAEANLDRLRENRNKKKQ